MHPIVCTQRHSVFLLLLPAAAWPCTSAALRLVICLAGLIPAGLIVCTLVHPWVTGMLPEPPLSWCAMSTPVHIPTCNITVQKGVSCQLVNLDFLQGSTAFKHDIIKVPRCHMLQHITRNLNKEPQLSHQITPLNHLSYTLAGEWPLKQSFPCQTLLRRSISAVSRGN
jgi:hypothetical protein